MNTWYVTWHTSVGMGATYYQGTEKVQADDYDEALELAQRNVWRRAFRDWGMNHIIVTGASTNANRSTPRSER